MWVWGNRKTSLDPKVYIDNTKSRMEDGLKKYQGSFAISELMTHEKREVSRTG